MSLHTPHYMHVTSEFENGSFTLKTRQTFSVHAPPEESPVILDLYLRKTPPHDGLDAKVIFQNVFLSRDNEKPVFSNSSGL